jgi:hypothetical protein
MVLERAKGWPADRMSRVLPVFKGRTVVCVASGPSLTVEQVEMVRHAELPTFVCNDSYRIAPFAALCYFADSKWWKWQIEKPEWQAFAGQKCTIHSSSFQVSDAQIHVLKNLGHEGLSTDPSGIMTGSHSGYQLANIATLTQPAKILLLGYDCQRTNGKKHWFGDHPDGTEPPYEGIKIRYNRMEQDAKRLGIEIINCTPGSAITAFPKVELASVLNHQAAALVSS